MLTCRVERNGPVLFSFFSALGLGQAAPREKVERRSFHVASLLDIARTKVAVIQKRTEAKDYQNIDALDWPAGRVVYGHSFNPLISLKALSFFDYLPGLPEDVRKRLLSAVEIVDPTNLPVLTPYAQRKDENGYMP